MRDAQQRSRTERARAAEGIGFVLFRVGLENWNGRELGSGGRELDNRGEVRLGIFFSRSRFVDIGLRFSFYFDCLLCLLLCLLSPVIWLEQRKRRQENETENNITKRQTKR